MSKIRISICQFGLRDTRSFDDMAEHLKKQCRKALQTRPDLLMFPEYTTLGLLGMAGQTLKYASLGDAMRRYIFPFTPIYEELFSEEARKSGCVILGGSHWIQEEPDGPGYNTAHVFYPDGRIDRQVKNHFCPGEKDWETAFFDGLSVYDAGWAKIGIMTCYDSEFPEVGRHLMLNGAQIFLSPSATYTERGFFCIRRCCAARAVENQVFVVEGHQAGALSVPVDRCFTAFEKSAILCPIDEKTAINDGILVEASAGDHETIVNGEIDTDILAISRNASEATILKDRRPSTYKEHYKLW